MPPSPSRGDPGAADAASSRCERLDAMIASLDQGIAFVDAAGVVREINERYLDLLGKSRSGTLGRDLDVLGLDTDEYQVSAFIDLFARGAANAPVAFNQELGDVDVTARVQPVSVGGAFTGVLISVIDVTPLVEARLAVEREKAFLEQVINIAGAAICIVNRDGVITNINDEFTNITGYTQDEVLGVDRASLLDDREDETETARPTTSSGAVSKRHVRIRAKTDGEVTILKNAAPFYDAKGRAVGGIESFVDVSELTDARNKAEQANRLKSVFLANMSHEIRTPLNAMLGLPQLLAQTDLSDEQREYVDIMRSAGESLLVIVNDILDFSKIEAGKMKPAPQRVNLRRLLEDVRLFMDQAAREKGLAFDCDIDSRLPAEVETDAGRLRQVLVNFLSNAIKFTAEGRISLSAELEDGPPLEGNPCRVRFSVSDTGTGIPNDRLGRIFEPFVQADGDISRHHGGTGLGLSISRSLAALLGGGDIRVQSALGRGSEFSFTLPLPVLPPTDAPTETAPPVASGEKTRDFGGLRVLVAEDNPFNRFLLQKILDKLGVLDVSFADNGEEAVKNVIERGDAGGSYDVIFMDVRMPVMDGLAAAREIRRLGVTAPIVALTAQAMSEAGQRRLPEGMDYYFAKPYDIGDLESVLGEIVEAGDRKAPAGMKPEIEARTRLFLLEELGVSESEMQEVLAVAVAALAASFKRLANALSDRDAFEASEAAHGLKGSLKNMGLFQAAETAAKLESKADAGDLEDCGALHARLLETLGL